ncbi:hypothetical protein Nepgr_015155 [Nepenthes gracilis]|uniref:Uncharacterized protein n=1 Tax=Nepenthes gracilis TaxID=150966 RepID=A0AAD3SM43_NEPGR|nr:hypothetical protein Nepgr_015155 [Nepenthes gracilis]
MSFNAATFSRRNSWQSNRKAAWNSLNLEELGDSQNLTKKVMQATNGFHLKQISFDAAIIKKESFCGILIRNSRRETILLSAFVLEAKEPLLTEAKCGLKAVEIAISLGVDRFI